MKVTAITKKGNHPKNEDRIIVGKSVIAEGMLITDLEKGIIAVADGVGGNKAGSVASDFVVKKLTELDSVAAESLIDINNKLIGKSSLDPELDGMATTLSGIELTPDEIKLFHVGNTRIWRLRNEQYLRQITTDDTTVNYLISIGKLSPEDVDSYDRKSEITACFGAGNPRMLRIRVEHIDPEFPVILTSDGIHDYLTLDEMEEIVSDSSKTISERCSALIHASEEAGSLDDKSIIFIVKE